MRAFAVLAVFADHMFGWPTGGFVGVDVFFVLSGFFITGLLLKERTATGSVSFRDFYSRRAKRILPSAVLVLVITVVASYVVFPIFRAKQALIDAFYAAVFAANFRFEALGADYFQKDQPPSPVQHYWSLSIEEQFYFVWPLLLVAIFAATRSRARRGNQYIRQWGIFIAMALIVAMSFGWALYLSNSDPNIAYFSTLTRIWELGVGALVAIAGPWIAKMPFSIRPVLAYLGLAGCVCSLLLISESVQFPAPWAALPVLSTALVVASFHGAEVRGVPLLTNPVARYFGDTSYTLYLWHWPVIILALAVVPRGPQFYCIAVTLALALTALTYFYFENPIRKSSWLSSDSRGTSNKWWTMGQSGWASVGTVLVLAIVLSILGSNYNAKLTDAREEIESASLIDKVGPLAPPPPLTDTQLEVSDRIQPLTAPLAGASACFGAPAILDANCALRDPSQPLKPSIETFTRDLGAPSCWTDENSPLKSCSYGYDGDDATSIALVGDSHASRILVALVPYLDSLKWRLTTYVGWGCVFKQPPGKACTTAMAETRKQLADRRYDLIVTTASRKFGGNPKEYASAWQEFINAGSRIAVLADNPEVSEEALSCLTRPYFGSDQIGDCGTEEEVALAKPDPLVAAAGLVPNSYVIDLTQYYCAGGRCPAIIGDVIVYRDVGSHVTATYFATLAPALVDGLRRALAA
ncbi:acyltransferase family protein [Mycolicibacterium litorale]|uniref:acyltransferase family protein n=1 Tax=Mycolicibacterium litorale TaxID=758802 RepID=UPI003CEE5834